MCLLPQNHLLCQQAAIHAMQLRHISIHIPNLIRIERGIVGEPKPCLISYRNALCLLPQNQLFLHMYQPAAIPAMQLGHISIYIPSLIRIEIYLVGEPIPRTLNVASFLIEIYCISRYMCLLPQIQLWY